MFSVYGDGFMKYETQERSMKKKRMTEKIRFPISITSALHNQASVRLPACMHRFFFSIFHFRSNDFLSNMKNDKIKK